MKKIFHFIPNLIVGGAQTFLKTLIDGLPTWDHQVLILENRIDPLWGEYNIQCIQAVQLMRFCKDPSLKEAIFHFHWFPPFQFLIPDTKRTRTIVTIQDNEPCSVTNAGTYVVSTVPGLKFVPPNAFGIVIAPSVDTKKWKNHFEKRSKGQLVRHSTIYPQKFSPAMMRDICTYDSNRYHWRIIGVGDPHYITELKKEYVLSTKTVLGESPNMCGELNRAWLYVYHTPANGEHYGLCFQEALACGLPVVTNDQMGAKDQIGDGVTGFICSSPEEMKNRVDELYEDDLLYDQLLKNVLKIDFQEKERSFLGAYEKLYHSLIGL